MAVHPGKVEPMSRKRCPRIRRSIVPLQLWLCAVVLCTAANVGCTQADPAEMDRLYMEWSQIYESSDSWTLAPDAVALPCETHIAESGPELAADLDCPQVEIDLWGFSEDTQLVRLPSVDAANTADLIAEPALTESNPSAAPAVPHPGVPDSAVLEAPHDQLTDVGPKGHQLDIAIPEPVEANDCDHRPVVRGPGYDELSHEERQLLDLIAWEALSATTGAPTDARLDQQCRDKITAAYGLSQRGAVYAARTELVEVLRLISQAKDARESSRTRTESLAAGLRALEEASDFVPPGSQLEAEMNLDVICAAHRTPLAREIDLRTTLPSKMMERYHRYAQIKLAVAVAGEPAGSMALYAMGKINSRLAAAERESHPLAGRKAVAFQQAALLAHNQNYMAAHELGVLLAESGHYPDALYLLLQVATEQPNPIVFRNLAKVQDALGNRYDAQLCLNEAARLARQGQQSQVNIAWVPPQKFSRDQLNTFSPQVVSRVEPSAMSPPAVARR